MTTRILAVDDDKSTCYFISKALTRHGFEVDIATDGTTALELVANHPYDLALLDYHMPDLDGAHLYEKIREIRPEMLAVFLTGDPTIGTVYPAIKAGAERVLAKPIGVDELLHVIQDQLSARGLN